MYALGATGFTLIFGVSGVLNLSHGALMVAAAVAAWAANSALSAGNFGGAAVGIMTSLVLSLITYGLIVRPIQKSSAIRNEEREIFILTATLLWGIMIQELIAFFFTNNAKTVLPILVGVVSVFGVRTPKNEIFTALICWVVIGALWLLVNRTRIGKSVLAASMNPRGATLLGVELSRVYILVWGIYGVLAGMAGVLLGMFLGVSSYSVGPLTASAFTIVVLGGLGSVTGSLAGGLRHRLFGNHYRLFDFAGVSLFPLADLVAAGDVHPAPRLVRAPLNMPTLCAHRGFGLSPSSSRLPRCCRWAFPAISWDS